VFLFFNVILEALVWASHGRNRPAGHDPEKHPVPAVTTETAGATAAAADGERARQPVA